MPAHLACPIDRPLHSGAPQPTAAIRFARPDTGELLAGRYRLTKLVGRGATARVWRAHDELLDRDVAVKQFCEQHLDAVLEGRTAARVRHPNVAAVHDVLSVGDSQYIVMDYYCGETLDALLRRGRCLSPPMVAALGQQLLAALRAVHAAGIVHCDVKPANLILGDDGRLILIDFGIAETVGGTSVHPSRRHGYVVGSPAYMAPELIRGGEDVGAPSDLWSFGVTLYSAVEGHAPFLQHDVVKTLVAVLHDPPSPPRLAARLEPLLTRLLVKEAAERPTHEAIQALLCDAYPARALADRADMALLDAL